MQNNLLSRIEKYIHSYVSFAVPEMALPIALWVMGTHIFQNFDSFAYLVITSTTKRSGKTRLSEIISFMASNPLNFSAMTPSTLFRVINPPTGSNTNDEGQVWSKEAGQWVDFVPPTIVFDEAEALSSEAAGTMRSVLNAGYRKGQSVPRTVGNEVIHFKVYCPKIFILIGDVYDTLRDRSVVITMRRAEAPKRFIYEAAQKEGAVLRDEIPDLLAPKLEEIRTQYEAEQIPFLSDREEEIWLPLFAICSALFPDRLRDLQRVCSDISAMKTADSQAYKELDAHESQGELFEYAEKAVCDLFRVMSGRKVISSSEAVEQMKRLDIAPWRTYKGSGLDQHNLGDLLATLKVRSVSVRIHANPGQKGSVLRGYRLADILPIVQEVAPELTKSVNAVPAAIRNNVALKSTKGGAR